MTLTKKHFLIALALVVAFGVLSLLPKNIAVVKAQRQAPIPFYPLSGWGWSSNIGWVSFSSANSGAGGGSYGVGLIEGALEGYAWSSNLGWIKFQGDAGHANPTVNLTTGAVSGWAHACAGSVNGDCTGGDRTDGWDGWISLSGTNHETGYSDGSRGITFNTTTGKFSGKAWGSDVVGWLSFDSGIPAAPPVTCPTCVGGTTLGGSCSGTAGTNSAVWTMAPSGGTTYTYSWNGAAPTVNNTFQINGTGPIAGPTVTVTSANGGTGVFACGTVVVGGDDEVSAKMWVNNNPAITTTKIRTGNSARINWSVSDYIADGYDLCTGIGSSLPNWSNISVTSDKPNGTPYLLPITTEGIYTLKIRCSMMDDPLEYKDTNTVQVIVTDSAIEEI